MDDLSVDELLRRVATHYERDTGVALGHLDRAREIASPDDQSRITDAARRVIFGFTRGAVTVAQYGNPGLGRELLERGVETAKSYGLAEEYKVGVRSVALELERHYLRDIRRTRDPEEQRRLIAGARGLIGYVGSSERGAITTELASLEEELEAA